MMNFWESMTRITSARTSSRIWRCWARRSSRGMGFSMTRFMVHLVPPRRTRGRPGGKSYCRGPRVPLTIGCSLQNSGCEESGSTRTRWGTTRAWADPSAGFGRTIGASGRRAPKRPGELWKPSIGSLDVIITSSPLRISLGGGGTDLPSYYREHTGFVISAAINKYVYITLHESFSEGIIVKYSKMETVLTAGEI